MAKKEIPSVPGKSTTFSKIVDVAGKIVNMQNLPVETPIRVIGAAVKAAYDTFDNIREHIHERKVQRQAKRESEAHALQMQLMQQQMMLQQMQQQNSRRFADSFGDESYDVETANAYEVRRISKELDRIRDEFKGNAKDIEKKIISFVQDSIKDTISEFESINSQEIGNVRIDLNISYLRSLEEKIERQITGFIQNSIRRKLSVDSEECADILRMDSKKAKQDAMREYQDRIFDEAVGELWEMIDNSIRSQNDLIYDQISSRLDRLEMNSAESLKQLEEIQKSKELDEAELNAKKEEVRNMIDIASWCIDELEKENA